ncbi:hypothetical protein EA462_03445 [Natrarchaeobius halalkaliphilus]|uniref:Uncharacterized protein n=1 Tax=Natrarchaeobius halalkaliphilus TaxID=1679091 RepID=A0A3N6P5A3_9EURY|nr:hypothetical protein EA462_03445 [Natrarchaeobius halalkaliphilus]
MEMFLQSPVLVNGFPYLSDQFFRRRSRISRDMRCELQNKLFELLGFCQKRCDTLRALVQHDALVCYTPMVVYHWLGGVIVRPQKIFVY